METRGMGSVTASAKEAAEWLVAMEDEPEHFDRREFLAWLQASPQHVREFLFLSAISHEVETHKPRRPVDVRQLVEESRNVFGWPETTRIPPRTAETRVVKRRRWLNAVLATAALAFVSAAGLWHLLSDTERVLTTAIGEQRAVRLADGSVVHLNTDSRVAIHFTETAREVSLLQGEALFTVEHDANRPFRVHTDSVTLQAIGTQFNVYRREGEKVAGETGMRETIVSVIEGRVAVLAHPQNWEAPADPAVAGHAPETLILDIPVPDMSAAVRSEQPRVLAVLAAGEQARVAAEGTLKQRAMDNVADAAAWRQRQLVFLDTPLAEVAAEIRRYTVAPKLDIQGEALRRQITAAFPADDVESLIQFLERDAQLSVIRSEDTVVIRARSSATADERASSMLH